MSSEQAKPPDRQESVFLRPGSRTVALPTFPPQRSDDFPLSYAPLLSPAALLSRDSDGVVSVALTGTMEVFSLNETAALVLSLCDGENTLREIVDVVARRCAIDSGRAEADVRGLMREFCRKGIVGISY